MISDIRNTTQFTAPQRSAASSAGTSTQSAEPQDGLIRTKGGDSAVRLQDLLAATADEARSLAPKLAEHVEGEVLVKLRPGSGLDGMDNIAEDFGGKVIENIRLQPNSLASDTDLMRIKLAPGMTAAEGIAAMSKDARVEYAVTNDILHAIDGQEPPAQQQPPAQQPPAQPAPDEPPADFNQKLWGMHNTGQNGGTNDVDIDAPEGWKVSTGSHNGPIIAVIDTGVDYTHKALKDNMWTAADGTHGYNAINDALDPMDDHYHGTHCAGTIGANGADGVYGVNHDAQIMGVKFLSASGGGTLSDAVKAIVFAGDHGARIVSNSWGGGGYNQALKDAIGNSPSLHIFAAGNESNNNDANASYPASYDLPNIVSVAAMDRNEQLASFSNYGKTTVDVAAPGVDTWSTVPGDKYKSLSGTSMATPHVSGVAGLIATVYPDATNDQIKQRLLNSVDPVAHFADKMSTGGRVNLAAALKNDQQAPDAAGNFGVAEAKAGRVSLSWLASGDDGQVGTAKSYQLRFSDKPIVDGPAGEGEVSFADAQSANAGAPGAPGSEQGTAIDLPLSGQEKTWYFALKVGDGVGNLSAMASTAAAVPAATLAFEDNDDAANWSTEGGTWAQVDVAGRGKVWTDSPDGDYANNTNNGMTSRAIDLSGITGSKLIFDEKHATENRYDKVHVEASADGQTWSGLAQYTGTGDWSSKTIDLSAFDGGNVQLRFRVTSDGSVSGDGVSIDNLVIAGSAVTPPPAEQPPAEQPPAQQPPAQQPPAQQPPAQQG